MPLEPNEAERLGAESKECIEKARDLLDEMKSVQEHETAVLKQEDEPPLFTAESGTR
jgi:hypothetical protein